MQHECPICHGSKETHAFVCGIGVSGLRTMPCDTCNALGWIDDAKVVALAEQKAKHETRLAARVALDLSQREMAKRLGMGLADYSSYEHGRREL